jgi:hypothetical protein
MQFAVKILAHPFQSEHHVSADAPEPMAYMTTVPSAATCATDHPLVGVSMEIQPFIWQSLGLSSSSRIYFQLSSNNISNSFQVSLVQGASTCHLEMFISNGIKYNKYCA